jgi:hypothetical protein
MSKAKKQLHYRVYNYLDPLNFLMQTPAMLENIRANKRNNRCVKVTNDSNALSFRSSNFSAGIRVLVFQILNTMAFASQLTLLYLYYKARFELSFVL